MSLKRLKLLDRKEAEWNVDELPLDILMDETKLKEFRDMFQSHLIILEDDKKKLEKQVREKEAGINFVKEKFETISGYIQFLQYGGHNFVKNVIRENRHVITNAERKVWNNMWGYQICGKEIPIKKDGWHVCIRKEGHKGKCSYEKTDRIRKKR